MYIFKFTVIRYMKYSSCTVLEDDNVCCVFRIQFTNGKYILFSVRSVNCKQYIKP